MAFSVPTTLLVGSPPPSIILSVAIPLAASSTVADRAEVLMTECSKSGGLLGCRKIANYSDESASYESSELKEVGVTSKL